MTTIDTSTEAVERLLENVTPGPWQEGQDGNLRVYGPDCCGEHSGLVAKVFKGRANTSFIAAARDMVPALLAERDEARAKVKALAEALEWYISEDDTNMGDTPMPDHGNRTWNEINAYWIEGKRKAETLLAEIKEVVK